MVSDSMFYLDLFMLLVVVGLLFPFISLVFFLLNRSRKKKGLEKKLGYRIAGSFCLAIGCLGLAAVFGLFLWADADNIPEVIYHMTMEAMPERAVLHRASSGKEEDIDDWDAEEDILEYGGKEYLPMSCYPVDEKIELSELKAYLQYAPSENYDGYSIGSEVVAEVTNDTGFDLLCTGDEDMETVFGMWPRWIYCRKEQCEEFQKSCQSGAVYYLEPDKDYQTDSLTGADFGLKNLGITKDFLDNLYSGQGEILSDMPNRKYCLSALYMDGLFSTDCANIGRYEGKWYCYAERTFEEDRNAYVLPDEGQKFLEGLEIVGEK